MSINPENLKVSSVGVTPITVDSWSDMLGEDMEGFTFWEPFTYEVDDTTEVTLLATNGAVTHVLAHGLSFDWSGYDDFVADWREDTDAGEDEDPPFTERDFDDLFQVGPEQWGSEGPMMNYWYPVEHIDNEDEARDAAAKLVDVPLCVVEVNGTYGLALTGGGMDLSWEICKAYVLLGALPPVHFADLPKMAGYVVDTDVLAAMRRSLDVTIYRAQYSLNRLNERYPA